MGCGPTTDLLIENNTTYQQGATHGHGITQVTISVLDNFSWQTDHVMIFPLKACFEKSPLKKNRPLFLEEKIQIEFSYIKHMTEAVFNHLNYLSFIV